MTDIEGAKKELQFQQAAAFAFLGGWVLNENIHRPRILDLQL